MSHRGRKNEGSAAGSGAERSGAEDPAAAPRGRPGRRTVADRTEAVLELLRGRATIEQLARRFGVREETIEGWREIALQGLGQALNQGDARSPEERELERRLKGLERAFTDLAIRHELVQREMAKRPSQPGRSSR